MASVSLDVSGIDWEKWMDVFLEFKPIEMPGVYLRLDGVATNGKYADKNGNNRDTRGVYGSFVTAAYGVIPLRIALQVGEILGTEFFFAVAYQRDLWVYDYMGTTNMSGTAWGDSRYKTLGKWCQMQTLNLAPSSGGDQLTLTGLRLIGMKRP